MDVLVKNSFCLLGFEGSSEQGEGFVTNLWSQFNAQYKILLSYAITSPQGKPVGIWGAMSDLSRSFLPWEEGFSKGLYLAGVECKKDILPPDGMRLWRVPGFRYMSFPFDATDSFQRGLQALKENGLTLVGAVQEYTDPLLEQSYLLYPIEKV